MHAGVFRSVLGLGLQSKTNVIDGSRNSNGNVVTPPMMGGVSIFQSEVIF